MVWPKVDIIYEQAKVCLAGEGMVVACSVA